MTPPAAAPGPRKIAILINGSDEAAFIPGLETSLRRFREAGVEVYLVNPWKPSDFPKDRYSPATHGGLEKMVAGLKTTEEDDVVVYNFGHGRSDCVILEDDACLDAEQFGRLISGLKYRNRTLVMTGCLSGNWAARFSSDPRNLFVSSGPVDEVVEAQPSWFVSDLRSEDAVRTFDTLFFSGSVRDLNGDGRLAFWERFENTSGFYPNAVFVQSANYEDTGLDASGVVPPFPAQVQRVATQEELEGYLGRLHRGQVAVVSFSLPGNPLNRMAIEDRGNHLYIEIASSGKDAPGWAQNYLIPGAGPMVLVTGDGLRWPVQDLQNPLVSQKILSPETATEDQVSWTIDRYFYHQVGHEKLQYLTLHAPHRFNRAHIRKLLMIEMTETEPRLVSFAAGLLSELIDKNPDLLIPEVPALIMAGLSNGQVFQLLAKLIEKRPGVATAPLFGQLLEVLDEAPAAESALAACLKVHPEYSQNPSFARLIGGTGSPKTVIVALGALFDSHPDDFGEEETRLLVDLSLKNPEAERLLEAIARRRPELLAPHLDTFLDHLATGRFVSLIYDLHEADPTIFGAEQLLRLARIGRGQDSVAELAGTLLNKHTEILTSAHLDELIATTSSLPKIDFLEDEEKSRRRSTVLDQLTRNFGEIANNRPDLIQPPHVRHFQERKSHEGEYAFEVSFVLRVMADKRPDLLPAGN